MCEITVPHVFTLGCKVESDFTDCFKDGSGLRMCLWKTISYWIFLAQLQLNSFEKVPFVQDFHRLFYTAVMSCRISFKFFDKKRISEN